MIKKCIAITVNEICNYFLQNFKEKNSYNKKNALPSLSTRFATNASRTIR